MFETVIQKSVTWLVNAPQQSLKKILKILVQ